MLELWDELLNLRREQQSCVADLDEIKAGCANKHGKPHVAQCTECWNLYLNRMRDRYLGSRRKEWFTGRRQFLQELDMMFSKARGRGLDFETIERRIYHEKEVWYRDRVKNIGLPTAAAATLSPSKTRLLQQKLNDSADLPVDELASQLRGIVADHDAPPPDQAALDGFIDRLKDAKSPQARSEVYIDTFFQPGHDPRGGDTYKKYIEMMRQGVTIADVVSAMLRDRQSAEEERKRKQGLQQKFEELKRAKTAHELSLAKKQKARQDKAAAAVASSAVDQQQHPRDHNHLPLPPCSACAETLDPQNFLACPLCQLLHEQYGLDCAPVAYCSRKCYENNYESHGKEAHGCGAGGNCASLDDEDVEMDGTGSSSSGSAAVFCRECVLSLKQASGSVFCSARCYDANFQHHRDGVHLPGRREKARGRGGGGEVAVSGNDDDEALLEYADEDRTQYRARKIEEHLITLDDALREYQQQSGAAISL